MAFRKYHMPSYTNILCVCALVDGNNEKRIKNPETVAASLLSGDYKR